MFLFWMGQSMAIVAGCACENGDWTGWLEIAVDADDAFHAREALRCGADPDGRPGRPPFASAAGRGNFEIVTDLLAAGANPRKALFTGWDAMMCAVGAGRVEMASFLSIHCDPNHRGKDGGRALEQALSCRSRHPDWEVLARFLLGWQGVGDGGPQGSVFGAFVSGCRLRGESGRDVSEERALLVGEMLLSAGARMTSRDHDRLVGCFPEGPVSSFAQRAVMDCDLARGSPVSRPGSL